MKSSKLPCKLLQTSVPKIWSTKQSGCLKVERTLSSQAPALNVIIGEIDMICCRAEDSYSRIRCPI